MDATGGTGYVPAGAGASHVMDFMLKKTPPPPSAALASVPMPMTPPELLWGLPAHPNPHVMNSIPKTPPLASIPMPETPPEIRALDHENRYHVPQTPPLPSPQTPSELLKCKRCHACGQLLSPHMQREPYTPPVTPPLTPAGTPPTTPNGTPPGTPPDTPPVTPSFDEHHTLSNAFGNLVDVSDPVTRPVTKPPSTPPSLNPLSPLTPVNVTLVPAAKLRRQNAFSTWPWAEADAQVENGRRGKRRHPGSGNDENAGDVRNVRRVILVEDYDSECHQ